MNGEATSWLWSVESGQELDQRGLARAILPEEAMNFPGQDREVHAVQCCFACKPLGEVADLQRRLRGHLNTLVHLRPQSVSYPVM